MRKLWKKFVAVTLAASMMIGLTACGSGSGSATKTKADGSAYKTVTWHSNVESGSLDSAGIISYWWWNYNSVANASLVELAEDGSYKYILAESVDINDEMTEYVFHIKKDANWNNGDAVTSQDFYNTITRALDPSCGNGYSSMLFSIVNAQEIYNGKADMSSLGVECVDEKTLKFTLKSATPYFMDMLTLPVYVPTHRTLQTDTNGAWAMGEDLNALVSCGAFYMAEYVPNQYWVYKKNESYVLKDEIYLDEIKVMAMDDTQAIINAYKTGELNIATADYTVLDEYKNSNELVLSDSITTYYELFDVSEPPFDDVRVRQAFTLAIDRSAVATACGTNYVASSFFVAPSLVSKASGKKWSEEAGGQLLTTDIEKAKKLLAEAGYPNGAGFPTVTYKYPSVQVESDIAQSLQAQWKKNLGIEVKLEAQEMQVNISDRRSGNFDICRMRWTADFADPFTYLAMYMSTDAYNDNKCACSEYDELMKASMVETDTKKRFELLHEAEKVLVEDYAWAVPVLSTQTVQLMNANITNRIIDPSRNSIRTKYLNIE